MTVPFSAMTGLVGWEFPGGSFTIESWENLLMYDATEGSAPDHGFAHPIYAFHAPLAGMGLSYQAFFDVCHAEAPDRIRAGEYDFRFHRPLREDVAYAITGEIESVERKRGGRAGLFDLVRFRLDMTEPAGTVACSAGNTWLFLRDDDGTEPVVGPVGRRPDPAPDAGDGHVRDLEHRSVGPVSAEKMKVFAAILRDPNRIHIDRRVLRERGLGDRLINQGPLNLGYVTDMLEANFAPGDIRRLVVRFGSNVVEADIVTAGGTVLAVIDEEAHCEIWLDLADGTRAISGRAIVAMGGGAHERILG